MASAVDGVGTTPLAGALTIDRPLSPEISGLLQSQVDRGYQEFLDRVAAGRRETPQQIDAIGQGRVWAGADARRIGLVDRLGTLEDAVQGGGTARQGNAVPGGVRAAALFLGGAGVRAGAGACRGRGGRHSSMPMRSRSACCRSADRLDPVTRNLEQLTRFSVPGHLYSYCFCSAATH